MEQNLRVAIGPWERSFEHPSDGSVAGLRGLTCLVVGLLSLSLRDWGSRLQPWGIRRQDKWMGRLWGNPC